MTTIVWLLVSLFAQVIVIFYPGVIVFWIIVHHNIERLRPLGTRSYWVAALAWFVTSVPLLFFRREIFSVRWVWPGPFAAVIPIVGALAFVFAVFFLFSGQPADFVTHHGRSAGSRTAKEPSAGFEFRHLCTNPQSDLLRALALGVLIRGAFQLRCEWIGFALDCVLVRLLIHAEERELLARYGSDFADYMSRVPRFFPQLLMRKS
jgi:hypothetical protein